MIQFELGPRQKQLVDALRSGKYKQCFKKLRKGDCFCAAGVMCDISGLGSWNYSSYRINGHKAWRIFLPSEVRTYFNATSHIIYANDKSRLSFDEIADELETKPKEYFHGPV